MRTVDWRTLWEEQAEPGEVRRVLCALSVSMGGKGGQNTNCSPSVARIARRAGMRRDSASRWIGKAEAAGWINVSRVDGLRNRYYATVPPEHSEALEEAESAPPRPKRQERKFKSRPDAQKCFNCESTRLVPKLYMGADTGLLECQDCGQGNEGPEATA